jgi:hypothetical protein
MEVERFIFALQETISFLRQYKSLAWSSMPVDEIIRRLEAEIKKARELKPVNVDLLDRLFAPTGPIQEISIESGWGTKFLRISEVVDRFTGGTE